MGLESGPNTVWTGWGVTIKKEERDSTGGTLS